MRRGLAANRTQAQRAIESGKVKLNGVPASRAATLVGTGDPIIVDEDGASFASRGGSKLDGALRDFDVVVEGKRWLDAGASTGGFTDRLLQGGALAVVAVDVGYGQLDWRLRNDERVTVMERTNVRNLSPEDLPWAPEGVVADLSFISLTQVIPALARMVTADGDLVLLAKPQFEAGKGNVGKGGVVRDPGIWRSSIVTVVNAAAAEGLGLVDATVSDLTGPAGNREFFVHLRPGGDANMEAVDRAVERATGEQS